MRILAEPTDLPLGPEERLLLEAVRAWGGAAEDLPAAAGGVTDWGRVVTLAAAHRVGTALSQALQRAGCALEPAAAEALQGLAGLEAGAGMVSRALTDDVVRALVQDGLQPILLKGAAVDRLVYPPQLPRTMSDVDLLLDPPQIEAAVDCLSRLGFVRMKAEGDEDDRYHTGMTDRGRIVELHWRFTHLVSFRFDNSRLRARAQPVEIADGIECLAPDFPDLFVHAAHHWVTVNRFSTGLQSLLDLVLLMSRRREHLDADVLIRRAVETRTTGAIFWALLILGEWGGTVVEERALAALRPPGWLVRVGAREVDSSFVHSLSHLGPRGGQPHAWSRLTWHLACTAARNPFAALPAAAFWLLRAPRGAPESAQLQTPLQRVRYLLRPQRWRRLWALVTRH